MPIRLPWRLGSSRGRRLTALIASVLDPEPHGDRERAGRAVLGLAQLAGHLHAGERVADPHGDADHPLELLGEAATGSAAAGEDDFADSERAGLLLVEAKRGNE